MLWNVTSVEYLNSGHLGCPGCGASLSMRHALKAMGEKTVVVIPACCWSIIAGPFPTTALSVPLLHVPFATAAACASGVRRAMISQGHEDVQVMVWAGDGGTFDIGFQALSGAADRNEDFIYVCYDNEAYMNTGVQQSSATPCGAWTTTTPGGKEFAYQKKDLIGIVLGHHPAYLATATISFPEDFYDKFEKAKKAKGFSFLHLLASCPPGWKIDSQDSLKVTRLAVDSGVFPLIELDAEARLRRTYTPDPAVPVATYLRSQKRFKALSDEEIEQIQAQADAKNKGYLSCECHSEHAAG